MFSLPHSLLQKGYEGKNPDGHAVFGAPYGLEAPTLFIEAFDRQSILFVLESFEFQLMGGNLINHTYLIYR